MTPGFWAIVVAATALAGLILNGQRALSAQISAQVARLDTRLDRVEASIAELRERMAHLEGLLEGLREAIAHNRAA